jgi:lysophospholipase L1-like esterase
MPTLFQPIVGRSNNGDSADCDSTSAKPALVLMPLGASITHGQESTDGNGYRDHLRTKLVEEGYQVDMVGNHPNGTMEDNANEGWPGFLIDGVHDKAKVAVPQYKPNLVLINAGTNDCNKDVDIPNAGERMKSLLDTVFSESPKATVVLSTLLPNDNPNTNERAQRVNEQLRQLVIDQQKEGRAIVGADFQGDNGLTVDDLVDGTHPTDAGYEKMVPVWDAAIQDAAQRGFLQEAE